MNEDIVVDWHEDQETNEWASHLLNFVHKTRLARTKGAPCAGELQNIPPLLYLHRLWLLFGSQIQPIPNRVSSLLTSHKFSTSSQHVQITKDAVQAQ